MCCRWRRFAVAADPARRPDAAAAPARRPACHVFRVLQGDADDPPAILPAIAVVPAERHVERAVEDDQGAALVLVARMKAIGFRVERIRDVDRPAGQRRAVLERQREDPVARTGRARNHGVEIDGGAPFVDRRRAGDPQRIDVPAPERGSRNRFAERSLPDLLSGRCIERMDAVGFRHHQQHAVARAGSAPIERLRIHLSRDPGLKCLVQMQRAGALPGQSRHDEIAAAVRMTVIAEHGPLLRLCGSRQARGHGRNREQDGGPIHGSPRSRRQTARGNPSGARMVPDPVARAQSPAATLISPPFQRVVATFADPAERAFPKRNFPRLLSRSWHGTSGSSISVSAE